MKLDDTNTNIPPDCQAAQLTLQVLLDGDPHWDRPEVAAHRAVCPSCMHDFQMAVQMNRAFAGALPPAMRQGFKAELLTNVVAHTAAPVSPQPSSRTVRKRVGSVLIAVSLCIAVVFGLQPTEQHVRTGSYRIVAKLAPTPKQERLGTSIEEIRDSLAQIGEKLTPTLPDWKLGKVDPLVDPELPAPMGEMDNILVSTRSGAKRSVEPLSNSARNAANFFWKTTPKSLWKAQP
ncbi:MAG: hypothetical protein R3B84_10135 [Zavarzinella sp.]